MRMGLPSLTSKTKLALWLEALVQRLHLDGRRLVGVVVLDLQSSLGNPVPAVVLVPASPS